eukprot:GEMP01044696.1.p1 GENE.GEMP01044696.1~~GEMP01044696.1.p1  ORF type:complete len:355 (+),score=60.14 GEMP01044696.1:66-1130(+)
MIKYLSLVLLVIQSVAVVVTMHYSQVGGTYLSTTAVVSQESIKFIISACMVWYEYGDGRDSGLEESWKKIIISRLFHSPRDMLRIAVPGSLYVLQNNLLFVATKNLASAEYMVLYQLKILTTSVLSVLILSKALSLVQWGSLVVLFMGCALAEIPGTDASGAVADESFNRVLGLVAVFGAVSTSGFAGVYTEKLLKQTRDSLWVRNVQLSFVGIVLGLVLCAVQDGAKIRQGGFFQGYGTPMVLAVILLNAAGGLIIAVILKYGDNILKCFASACALILTYVVQKRIEPAARDAPFFLLGALLVCVAVTLYSLFPPKAPPPTVEYDPVATDVDVEFGIEDDAPGKRARPQQVGR